MTTTIFPAQHAQDSFYLEVKTREVCEGFFQTEICICNDAGWRRDHMEGAVSKTTDLRSIPELDSEINYIKGELKQHPNRDRHYADLDNLLKAGSRLFRDEDVRFKEMRTAKT